MEIPTADEMLKRVDAALKEIGVTAPLELTGAVQEGWPVIRWRTGQRTEEDYAAAWQAYKLAGAPISCWACWRSADIEKGKACRDGDCRSPAGPPIPPRELLQIRRH